MPDSDVTNTLPDPAAPHTLAILGAGLWGGVLAGMLANKGHLIRVWDPVPAALEHLRRERHPRSLTDWRLPDSVKVVDSLAEAVDGAHLGVLATRSQDIEAVGARIADTPASAVAGWVLVSKGLHPKTGAPLSEVLRSTLAAGTPVPPPAMGVVSGPCIATEVARGIPTSVVAASDSPEFSARIQRVFSTPRFRVYTQSDLLGVEIAAALKNVIAISAGVCDGLGFGDNSKAALITRGIAEISRLGVTLGAQPQTFSGLAGMGDLIVTSFSPSSRNRRCGEALARGRTLAQARVDIGMAIEGVEACEAACALAKRHGISLPICEVVRAILTGRITPREAVDTLMLRDPKPE